jgi:phosphoribosylanthranilate isomerase
MKIKVCGLKHNENIIAVAGLKPDYMGFIFYDKTPRFANDLSEDILKQLPLDIQKTGVFVNETMENIHSLIEKYDLDTVQLHGDETPDFCEQLMEETIVIKAFGINESFDFEELKTYINKIDIFLFDTKTPIHGGSGKAFDWDLLDKYELDIPFFLSGGISLDNLGEIKNIMHPMFYGVDLNSRFEIEPGLKDINKLEQAFGMLKPFDTNEIRS